MAKVRVWRKITPQQLNIPGMRSALKDVMQDIADDIKEDFHATTESWDHQPKFYDDLQFQGGPMGNMLRVEVYTNDLQYSWVNDGTPEHWEEAVNAQSLFFTYKSSPKTFPGVIDSGDFEPGQKNVAIHGLLHPGAEPRHFDKAIAGAWRKIYRQRVNAAMKNVAKASGHSMNGSGSNSTITDGIAKAVRQAAVRVVTTAAVAGIVGPSLPGVYDSLAGSLADQYLNRL